MSIHLNVVKTYGEYETTKTNVFSMNGSNQLMDLHQKLENVMKSMKKHKSEIKN